MGDGDVTQVAAPDVGLTRFIARIEASPDQHTATLNQKVTYRIVLEESTGSNIQLIGWGGEEPKFKTPREMFDGTGRTTKDLTDDFAIGSDSSAKPSLKQLKHRINWYVLYDKNGDGKADAYKPYDPELRIRHNPTEVEFEWTNEGQHVVLCYIGNDEPSLTQASIAKLAETQLLFRQWVGSHSTVQFRQFRDAKSKRATNPFVEYEALKKYLSVIDAAKRYRPAPPNKEKEFAQEISDYEDYLDDLRRLMPEIRTASIFAGADLKAQEIARRYKMAYSEAQLLTSGLACLLPVASYVSKDTSERRPIRLCLFYRWEFRDSLHMLHVSLVDWTNPTDKRLCGRYDASDTSPYKAVTTAIDKWRDGNKYYHPGNLKVEIPKIPMPPGYDKNVRNDSIQVNFDTRQNVWDNIQNFLSAVALWLGLAAALLAFIVPIPGAQVAAPLIWEALFAGAAASVISIARRRDQGFADWKEDALDLLGIVDAVFKVGKVAGKLAWSRGASMTTRQIGAKLEKYIAYGEWTRDKLEMLLIADQVAEQFVDLLSSSDLDPKERVDKLREFLKTTGVSRATSYINVRAAKRLARAQAPPQIPPDTLARLNDPKAVIDLDKPRKQAENTKNKVGKTTAEDEPARTVNPGDGNGGKPPTGGKSGGGGGRRGGRRFPWPEKKDDGWKVHSVDNPDLIHLERKKEKDGYPFYFKAGIEGNSVWVDLKTRIKDPSGDKSLDKVSEALGNAGSLFRSMFEHFEGRIEGWHGYFRESNYEAIKETVQHLRQKNTPRSGYEKALFDYSYTGPNWRKWVDERNLALRDQGQRLEIEIVRAEPDAGKPLFHFRVKFNIRRLEGGT